MKKFIILFLFLVLVTSVSKAQMQTLGIYVGPHVSLNPLGFSPLNLGIDGQYCLMPLGPGKLSVGPDVNYMSSSTEITTGTIVTKTSSTTLGIGGAALWHYGGFGQIEPYGGLSLTYSSSSAKTESGGITSTDLSSSSTALGIPLGVRYYISQNLSVGLQTDAKPILDGGSTVGLRGGVYFKI